MSKPTKHRNKWRIRWFNEKNERQSEVFDSHREASQALTQHEAEVQDILRGIRSPAPPEIRFDELCEYYLKNITSQKRQPENDQCLVRVHLLPYFQGKLLREIADMIDTYKTAKTHLNKKTLHNHLTLLISMLRVAHEKGWLLKLPKIKKPRIRLFDKDFNYLRTKEEITKFLIALEAEGELVYTLYATALYTGMREGELAGLQRADIDLGKRLICVQRSYDGPTKGGDVRYVPILDPLLPILRRWLIQCPGTHVFANRAGNMHSPSARIFQEIIHRVLDRAEFHKILKNGKVRRYIVFHDLRHTFASHWMMNGGDLFRLQKILGHKDSKMTLRYAHLAPDAYASDYGRLGKTHEDKILLLSDRKICTE
jgi:integrase